MEKDLSKDWPEVTVVSTTGELEERPMSMYTENICCKIFPPSELFLTVRACVDPTDGGDGRPPGHDEHVVLALVVRHLGLGQHEVSEVQSAKQKSKCPPKIILSLYIIYSRAATGGKFT